jgi:hypothetical protein
VVYELALDVAAFWLSSSSSAFSWPIIGYILQVNALGLGTLLIVKLIAAYIGLPTRPYAYAAENRS